MLGKRERGGRTVGWSSCSGAGTLGVVAGGGRWGRSLGEVVMCCSAQCQLFVCKYAFRLGLAGLSRAVGWLGFGFGSRL